MGKKEKVIDAYIARAAGFAKPILEHLRDLVHKACPDVQEKMKWSFPHFDYKDEMLCSMAAFKQHCAFGFWKASLMKDKTLIMNAKQETAMGHMGRITSLEDLPSDKVMLQYIREAMALNDEGIKVEKKKVVKTELEIPEFLTKALGKNKNAAKTFAEFSYSSQKDYVTWLTEAKTEETRNKRLATAVEWLEEGKKRHWKYATK
jgi:uncharacterized protein YdeI (YjbR/CyaY-like superfamily)